MSFHVFSRTSTAHAIPSHHITSQPTLQHKRRQTAHDSQRELWREGTGRSIRGRSAARVTAGSSSSSSSSSGSRRASRGRRDARRSGDAGGRGGGRQRGAGQHAARRVDRFLCAALLGIRAGENGT